MTRDLIISDQVEISGNRPETLKLQTDRDIIEELQMEAYMLGRSRFKTLE